MLNLSWIDKLKRILPDSADDQNTRFFKLMIYVVTGLLLIMILSSTVAFMITLQSAEQVMIPDVTGLKLEDALVAIQERGLNSRIQLRYSASSADRGNVIEQDPNPGTVKKAGNQVVLRVSRGAIIDKVENYVGWHINDLETHLRSIPLIRINEPLMRVNSEKPEGIILEQKPLPGTDISSDGVELALVVSVGSENRVYSVPDFMNLDYMTAMQRAASLDIPFLFVQRDAQQDEERGVVVEQRPAREESVPDGTILQLTITPPAPAGGKIFGILERVLPEHPVAVDTSFFIISEDGVKEEVFKMKHKGGPFAIPYFENEGMVLVISVLGRDQVHFVVR